ncbi:peroxiredoxin [soil metagenome]
MAPQIGEQAPDFELKDQHGQTVTLSGLRGKQSVVLVFYPFTFTSVCEGELCQIRDDFSDFEGAGAQVLAVSCDSRHAQKMWADQRGYNFPVLSDFWPHGEVSRAYGVFDEKLGAARRGTFVSDTDGTLVDAFESEGPGTPRQKERYQEAMSRL